MKQETLEETANEYAKKKYSPKYGFADEDYYISFLSFKDGTKWQQERSYSEEDLLHFYNFIKEKCDTVNTSGYAETHVKWFIKQFKKK